MHSPARHGDFHFGRRDTPTDRVEVTDRCRGLNFVHNVSLHVYGRPEPAPRAAWVPLSRESRRWMEEESRSAAGERAAANTVQTNLLSAVHWTGNSMESLMGGCSSGGIDLTKVGSHARTHQRQLRCFPAKNELFCQSSVWKVKAVNSTPPVCILPHVGLRLTLVADSSFWSVAR